jgi:hypothetical protein
MKYSDIYFDALRTGLSDLSESKEMQFHRWSGGIEGEMSTFEEAVCLTFDDSGLAKVVDSARDASTIPAEVNSLVDSLSNHLFSIPENLSVEELCSHPEMVHVRIKARKLLDVFGAELVVPTTDREVERK